MSSCSDGVLVLWQKVKRQKVTVQSDDDKISVFFSFVNVEKEQFQSSVIVNCCCQSHL